MARFSAQGRPGQGEYRAPTPFYPSGLHHHASRSHRSATVVAESINSLTTFRRAMELDIVRFSTTRDKHFDHIADPEVILTVDAAGRDEGSVTADEFKKEPLVIPPGPHFRRSGRGAVDTRKSHHGQVLPSGTVRPSPSRIQSGGKECHEKQTGHDAL